LLFKNSCKSKSKKIVSKYRIIFVFLVMLPIFSIAQPGISIQVGPIAAFSPDKNITPSGQMHYGLAASADARLLGDDMYFVLGGQYQQMSLMATKTPQIFKNDWVVLGGRFGLGFTLASLTHKSSLRTKVLASLNFIMDAPRNALDIPGYSKLNDSYLGGISCIGLTCGIFDFDLEYQHGFINAYNKQPKSTFNSFALLAGIKF